MIEKVQYLVSIGRFRNYQATGVVTFKKLTLIYADNGSGKTTLTRVIKSLCDNNPDLIRMRASTGATAAQSAQIWSTGNSGARITHSYNASGWSAPLPNVEIFDIHFVNDNVYSGFEFTDDHKKRLHQFVMGAQGVLLQQQIEQNKADKTRQRQLIDTLRAQLLAAVKNGMTDDMIPGFLAFSNTPSPTATQEIAEAQAGLASANANTAIQAMPMLQQLQPLGISFDFDKYEADIQSNTHIIQDATLKTLFEDHAADLAGNDIKNPGDWLLQGFKYTISKHQHIDAVDCPFCKRQLDENSEIFNAYLQKFNETFNRYVLDIANGTEQINRINIDSFIQILNERIAANAASINTWSSFLSNATAPSFTIIQDEANFRAVYALIVNDFFEKTKNPSIAISPKNLQNFRQLVNDINAAINASNIQITAYNNEIGRFKAGIQTVSTAQMHLNVANRKALRSDATIDALCTRIRQEVVTLNGLDSAYRPLVQAQETAVATFFSNYGARINHYLQNVFKTPFQIVNVSHVAPQGKATLSKLGYSLTINGVDIANDPSASVNLKETLSEGDKSTIAFAFFLSKLDIDPNLADKIIVFDDPLSSFDRNRKTYTVGLLRALLPVTKQVVVLSHNENFLHSLSTTHIAAGQKVTLWISQNFSAGTSEIQPLDLDTMVENDYFTHIKELDGFLTSPNITKKDYILGLIRLVLEAHIKFKFHRQLLTSAGGPTFGALITRLSNASVTFRDTNTAGVYSSLRLLNDICWQPHHGDPQPSYPVGGIDPTSMTPVELANCITDTFDLIENRL